MKERFRFRAWNLRKGIMHYNAEETYDGITEIEHSSFGALLEDWGYVVMQSTGLHDKNGKLIYEGDLLRYPAKSQYEERCYTFFEVFWHDNDCCDNHIGWQMNRLHPMGGLTDCSRNHKFIPRITEQMEIIGNIYENKKLLEEQK